MKKTVCTIYELLLMIIMTVFATLFAILLSNVLFTANAHAAATDNDNAQEVFPHEIRYSDSCDCLYMTVFGLGMNRMGEIQYPSLRVIPRDEAGVDLVDLFGPSNHAEENFPEA